MIRLAHERGIRTWVSLEPVIYPDQALAPIRVLHPVVDHWKVGKLNYLSPPEPVNRKGFREDVAELLESIGAEYSIKTSLTGLGWL